MFFDSERLHFFRPLSGRHRAVVVAALRALYERLHGPSADYAHNLTREGLRELLIPVVRDARRQPSLPEEGHATDAILPEHADDANAAAALMRALLRDGWLESFGDRSGLVTAFRLTRAGKLFAEAFWAMDRPSARTRQRNVRSCRNALDAALKNLDAYDLVDAWDYAEKVIGDLAEGVDYFQELVRRLMQEAAHTPWDGFIEFLDRFEKEFKQQLTADNIERHRQAIRDLVLRLHALQGEERERLEAQLNDIARWARAERSGASTLDWMLFRIEDMVEAACNSRHPELIKAMSVYMQRATSIVQQALVLTGSRERHAWSEAIARVADAGDTGDAQDALLARIGIAIAGAELRLLDPSAFRLRNASTRRRALNITAQPKISREARLAAAMGRAEAGAFAVPNEDLVARIRAQLQACGGALRLSELPAASATEVLGNMQLVEALRSGRGTDITVTRLPTRLENACYSGADYLIVYNA
ncbi:Wadjet anti-phage system protein JetA family protein [Noviherbaspirillum pedocola]|uniref:Ferrochelatase n=1 Tax=Noviherbaspirillum pedocola TaxID=2801341 RepID=A0A934SPZ5_9BURK|nr:Wadjet anti-phage system protein JetA family protein [Noviherbaspirillum pedocola]MBK4733339.1 ferrochelatase [Noviherbaspirillum pedocola]